ncbi:MAG TPA: TMEM175 family protein [Vitreimonas sp.]|jgi:uncharacterized membrane protein|nr:TMEM175 family protein [Vitreimonas sp.]
MADDPSADRRMLDRMMTFSDGVFAVALTLLALELRPPEGLDGTAFWVEIIQLIPQTASLMISFALASLWWAVHLLVTRELTSFDWPTALCNLVFLFFIVLLPFAAGTFGSNMDLTDPLALYWMINACVSFSMTLMYFVMTRDGGRLVGGIGWGERIVRLLQAAAPGMVFVLGAYWALVDQIWLSRFCCVLMAPIMIVLGTIGGMLERRRMRVARA